MKWRAYFEDKDGLVLRSGTAWSSPEEAAMWASSCLLCPEAFELEDPGGEKVPARRIDISAGTTVEAG